MRARLIANPESGTDRAVEMLPLLRERLGGRYPDLAVTVTTSADDARRAGAMAVEEQCAAVYVAGGDGTVNATLQGMLQGHDQMRVPIGIVPLGTGNDFAKALDLGEDPEAALERLLDGRVIEVDVGLMNDRPFFNTSAGGFVADVSDAVSASLKDLTGKLAYVIGGARALVTASPIRTRLLLPADGAGPDGGSQRLPAGEFDVQMFVVCNARFIGGGYAIAPSALIDDGLLDVLVVPGMSLLEFVSVLQGIGSSGDPGNENVLQFRASAFDLEFDRPAHVNVDGEPFEARRCSYRVRPRAARFFCGPAPHAVAQPR